MNQNTTTGILLIGGPSTGKSTTILHLEKMGYTCLPEISREVTIEAKRQGIEQLFVSEPLLFSEKLLEGRIKQHQTAASNEPKLTFIDRGVPDVLAYLKFSAEAISDKFTAACEKYRYTKVFFFPIWDEIYEQDSERYESILEAKKIEKQLIATYHELGYTLIEVPKDSVEKRGEFILSQLT
jgi:predicted ATPase